MIKYLEHCLLVEYCWSYFGNCSLVGRDDPTDLKVINTQMLFGFSKANFHFWTDYFVRKSQYFFSNFYYSNFLCTFYINFLYAMVLAVHKKKRICYKWIFQDPGRFLIITHKLAVKSLSFWCYYFNYKHFLVPFWWKKFGQHRPKEKSMGASFLYEHL